MARGTGSEGNCGISVPRGRDAAMLARLQALAERHDLDAYLVGGAVRDGLAGRPFKDPDVCVCGLSYEELVAKLDGEGSLSPLEITRQDLDEDGNQIGEPILVGLRLYADWTPPDGIEFALARTEISDGDGHKDFRVVADPSVDIVTDLARRDFTVNAIARSLRTGEIVDPYGGQDDLAAGVLRTVTPNSFQEDPLRILRVLPRLAKDGLVPTDETIAQMKLHLPLLRHVSQERIRGELEKTLMGADAARSFRFARDIGLLTAPEILPEFTPCIGFDQRSEYHALNVDEHIMTVLDRACGLDAPLSVRWAALLHDIGKPKTAWEDARGFLRYYRNPADPASRSHEENSAAIAHTVLKRLRLPDAERQTVEFLVREHMFRPSDKPLKARRFLARVGQEHIDELLLLRRADHGGKTVEGGLDDEARAKIEAYEELLDSQAHHPLTLRQLKINGADVTAFGFEGPPVGEQLRGVLSRIVDRPELNDRARQLDWLEKAAVQLKIRKPDEAAAIRRELSV
jgi:tRNA nucleotidyltransferase (CCA-adding enzyme)